MKEVKRFKPGDRVEHPWFGIGVVIEEWGAFTDRDDSGFRVSVNGAGTYDILFRRQEKRRSVNVERLTPCNGSQNSGVRLSRKEAVLSEKEKQTQSKTIV
jgi:hypothetical protein